MSKSKDKKIETNLKRVIAEVAEEEMGNDASKSSRKSVKKTIKNTMGKATKKDSSKPKKSVKKVASDDFVVTDVVVKEKRSRKKKEKVENNSLVNENENIMVNSEEEFVNHDLLDKDGKKEIIDVISNDELIEENTNEINIENLDVDDKEKDENNVFKAEVYNNEKMVPRKKIVEKSNEKKPFPKIGIVGIVVVIILVFAIIIATKTMKTVIPNVASVNSISDLNNKLDTALSIPRDVKNIQYGIEGDGIARMDYQRNTNNGAMNIIFRMSKNPDKDLYGESHEWGERTIYIDVACEDGIIINVESYEALDEPMALIALWKDNNEYYSLFTKNMSTKEDFYREVNQIVVANHKTQ